MLQLKTFSTLAVEATKFAARYARGHEEFRVRGLRPTLDSSRA